MIVKSQADVQTENNSVDDGEGNVEFGDMISLEHPLELSETFFVGTFEEDQYEQEEEEG